MGAHRQHLHTYALKNPTPNQYLLSTKLNYSSSFPALFIFIKPYKRGKIGKEYENKSQLNNFFFCYKFIMKVERIFLGKHFGLLKLPNKDNSLHACWGFFVKVFLVSHL